MDRAQRRTRKALIRKRLRREFERQQACYWHWPVPPSPEQIARDLRRSLRNEGKPVRRCYDCGATCCDWCLRNKTCRACREAERMGQEQRAWIAGDDPNDPITEEELQSVPCVAKRAKTPSASQKRWDKKHCPVCLTDLSKNALRTRLLRWCVTCGAHPVPHKRCRQCSAAAIWENSRWAACQACGLHGAKKDVIAA